MQVRLLSVLTLALGFSIACGGGAETTTATPPAPPAPVATDGSIGVPECDDYIKKMEACIATADPTTKAAMETGFNSTRTAWAQAAAIPETKATLASSCSAMLASVPTNCGAAASTTTTDTPVDGTTVTTTATTNADGTPAGTTTTTTTVVTTKEGDKAAAPAKSSAKAPPRQAAGERAPDMSRSRPGTAGSTDKKSGDGSSGMGRSRPK